MLFHEYEDAYIVVNNMWTMPCVVIRPEGDMCVIVLDGENGAIRVRTSRLYKRAEDTGKPMAGTVKDTWKDITPQPEKDPKDKIPWDWV